MTSALPANRAHGEEHGAEHADDALPYARPFDEEGPRQEHDTGERAQLALQRSDVACHVHAVARIALVLAALLAAVPAGAERIYSDDALATELLGRTVVNRRAERLGEVRDIVVDLARGEARAVLVESGGFLGLFETVRAFPFAWLARGRREHVVVLDVHRAELDVAGRAPRAGTRASDILGATVHDASGVAGEVRDLVLNLGDGKVRHAVLVLGERERQLTVDPRRLAVGAEGVRLAGTPIAPHPVCAPPC
jgi:sporulation protein YlmC with PRC-barrel domain